MKSPENKALSFLFWSAPGTHGPDIWTVRVTIPPGATAEVPLTLVATGENAEPIAKGSFEFMGARVKIVNGEGQLLFGDFVKGIHETGVWMMRPGHPPVPGALTFG
jgi:hypothetical protein